MSDLSSLLKSATSPTVPSSIDLNNSMGLFNDLLEKHPNIAQRFTFEKTFNEAVKFLGVSSELLEKGFPFKVIGNRVPGDAETNRFIKLLLNCDDRLFYKYQCVFKSPFGKSTVMGKPLKLLKLSTKNKEFYRAKWINAIFEQASKDVKPPSNTFKLDSNLSFSLDNLTFLNEEHRIIGLRTTYNRNQRTEIFSQLLYLFPAMFLQKIVKNPKQNLFKTFYCFMHNEEDYFICVGTFRNQLGKSSKIEIEISATYTKEQSFLFSTLVRYINSRIWLTNENFAQSLIKYGKEWFKLNKSDSSVTLASFHDRIMKKWEEGKKNQQRDNEKEKVRERSQKILTDATRFYRDASSIDMCEILATWYHPANISSLKQLSFLGISANNIGDEYTQFNLSTNNTPPTQPSTNIVSSSSALNIGSNHIENEGQLTLDTCQFTDDATLTISTDGAVVVTPSSPVGKLSEDDASNNGNMLLLFCILFGIGMVASISNTF